MLDLRGLAILGGLALMLVGCMSSGQKQDAGALTGSGLAYNNTATVGTAPVVAGSVRAAVGRDLNEAELRIAMEAETQALESGLSGSPITWTSRSGKRGEIIPGASYRVNDTNCRDYTHTIFIGGKPRMVRGTACRGADGSWHEVA